MKEVKKMQHFDHPHVLNVIGLCLDAGSAPYIVMPFMANGSLQLYLRKEQGSLVVVSDADEDIVSCLEGGSGSDVGFYLDQSYNTVVMLLIHVYVLWF